MQDQYNSDEWYVSRNGAQHGPITHSELKELLQSRRVSPDDYIWCPDFTDWKPAGEIFAPVRRPPPPPPARGLDNRSPSLLGQQRGRAEPSFDQYEDHGQVAASSVDCPFCGEDVPSGRYVCKGCGASVTYGKMADSSKGLMAVMFVFVGGGGLIGIIVLPLIVGMMFKSSNAALLTALIIAGLIFLGFRKFRSRYRNKVIFTKGLTEKSVPMPGKMPS